MILVWQERAEADLRHWVSTDKALARKVAALVRAVEIDPFEGIGKPERLRHVEGNVWSRRITREHRVVYLVLDDRVIILATRYHYGRS